MSFGFSVGDFVTVAKLVKSTLDGLKSAPDDFREAEQTVRSLHIILESCAAEVQSKTSVFSRDAAQAEQFSQHYKLCEGPVTRLHAILVKHSSLGTDQIKFSDRVRVPRRTLLEIRGELASKIGALSAYLATIGLGGLGRVEATVDNIERKSDKILEGIDRLFAEARLNRRTASYLSDHSNDDKAVWKQLRRDLNNIGFKSADIELHKASIFDKVRELQDLGMLDWDKASVTGSEAETIVTFVGHDPREYLPPTVVASSEVNSGYDNITVVGTTSAEDANQARSTDQQQEQQCEPYRVWMGRHGNINIKARLVEASSELVYIQDKERDEIILPRSNLSPEEENYVKAWKLAKNACKSNEDATPRLRRCRRTLDTSRPIQPVRPTQNANTIEDDGSIEEIANDPNYDTEILHGIRDVRRPLLLFKRHGDINRVKGPFRSINNGIMPEAASMGDTEKVLKLLRHGENIEAYGPKSYSYQYRDSEGAEQTAYVNYDETTALFRAAVGGHLELAHILLKKGAKPTTYDRCSKTVLDVVIAGGRFSIIGRRLQGEQRIKTLRLLLEYGADVEVNQPLLAAAAQGSHAIVDVLLEHGANINSVNGDGESALFIAAWAGHLKTVKVLLREGAKTGSLSRTGQSALYKAAGEGHSEVVKVLLLYGANPAVGRGKAGESVLYKACRNGQEQCVRLLLRRRADPDIENEYRQTKHGTTKDLLMKVLQPTESARNEYGQRPLYAAAYLGRVEIVKTLIEYGVDVNARREDDLPAIYVAADMARKQPGMGHKEVVRILKASGAQQLDPRMFDPVERLESDDYVGTSDRDLKKRNENQQMSPTERLLDNFTKASLTQGGDGLKTIGKILNVRRDDRRNIRNTAAALGTAALFLAPSLMNNMGDRQKQNSLDDG